MKNRNTALLVAIAAVLSMLVLLVPSAALAAQSGDFLYQVHGSTVEITGYKGHGGAVAVPGTIAGKKVTAIGEYAFCNCYKITSMTLPDGITEIGEGAFSSCYKMTAISLPDSVVEIGEWAFDYCLGLRAISLPSKITNIADASFSSCENLASIIIPQGVLSIGPNAFNSCTNLKTVVIPDSVTSIGAYAFDSCDSLTSITVPWSVESMDDDPFSGCHSLISIDVDKANQCFSSEDGILYDKSEQNLIGCPAGKKGQIAIPDGVEYISREAFWDCKLLTNVSFPNTLSMIDAEAFSNCTGLTSLQLPKGLTDIENNVFDGDTGLKRVTIPDGVETISSEVFRGCTKLKSISIPESVEDLGYDAFEDCSMLQAINVDPSNEFYESSSGVLIEKENHLLVVCPQSKTGSFAIPDGIEEIREYAFSGCAYLTGVSFPSSVNVIEDEAFEGCKELKNVVVGKGVTEIGYGSFERCTGLTSISLPANLYSIGRGALISGYGFGINQGSLTKITVNPSNQFFASKDGVLYNKSLQELVCYPCGRKGAFTVPNTVTSIGDCAFADSMVTGITFPSSVSSIGENSFYNCYGLKSIILPKSIVVFSDGAFAGCDNLKKEIFQGSQPTFSEYAFWYSPTDLKIYYPISYAASWASFNEKGIGKQPYCLATLNPQNGSPSTQVMANVTKGHIASPAAPARKDYAFGGWYKEAACIHAWSFATDVVKGDVALFASWVAPAPVQVSASPASFNSISLSWKPVSVANGYEVCRSTAKTGKYALVGTTSATSFTDGVLTTGKRYYYKVRSYTLSGSNKSYGPWSDPVYAVPAPSAPVPVQAQRLGTTSASVSWGAVEGITKYQVWRCSTSATGIFTLLQNTAALNYTDTSLAAGKTYYYKVRAYRLAGNKKIYGAWSAVVAMGP